MPNQKKQYPKVHLSITMSGDETDIIKGNTMGYKLSLKLIYTRKGMNKSLPWILTFLTALKLAEDCELISV